MIAFIKKDFITNQICSEKDLHLKINSQISQTDSVLYGNLELISLDKGTTKNELLKLNPDSLQNLIKEYNIRIARDTNQYS